ncbi:unnamed protein product, partial [Mycena citricolor]
NNMHPSAVLLLCLTLVRALPSPRQSEALQNASVMDPLPNTTVGPYPTYQVHTPFDRESFKLGLMQEWIELDLFHYGLAKFSPQEWQQQLGVNRDGLTLIQFMANQESGHAQLLTNILGEGNAPLRCTYNYSFVRPSI